MSLKPTRTFVYPSIDRMIEPDRKTGNGVKRARVA